MQAKRRLRDDTGITLVEVLVAVVILGLAGVAVMASLELSVRSSDLGRKQAHGGTYVRSLAEAIQNSVNSSGAYKACAAADAYLTTSVRAQAGLPSNYVPSQSAAQPWNGSQWATGACADSDDKGTQQITLTVTSPGTGARQASEKLTVIIRKPCNGDVPSPSNQLVKPC